MFVSPLQYISLTDLCSSSALGLTNVCCTRCHALHLIEIAFRSAR